MLTIPTVHLNGTSKQSLLDEYIDAMNAIDVAITAICNVTVHGRDYYPQGNDAILQASKQKHCQVVALQDVKTELETIALAIMNQ